MKEAAPTFGALDSMVPQTGTAPKSIVETKQLVVIDEVIAWWVMNPGKSIVKAAKQNGGPIEYSATWLKMLVSSDAFKARLAVKQTEYDQALLIPQLREKLLATTEAAVERLGEMIPTATDPQFVLDSAEMLLKTQYGLQGNRPAAQDAPGIHVDQATFIIGQEREALLRGDYSRRSIQDATVIEGERGDRPALSAERAGGSEGSPHQALIRRGDEPEKAA